MPDVVKGKSVKRPRGGSTWPPVASTTPVQSSAEPWHPSHAEKRAPALDTTMPCFVRRPARAGISFTTFCMAAMSFSGSIGASKNQVVAR